MTALEVADIFRRHGEAYRQAHAGHLGRSERRIMGAIEACRTARLGGHIERCTDCGLVRIAYNSCRNRHCPKCQGPAQAAWLAAADEFIRRFLLHALPDGFHRIRHYGFLANRQRADKLTLCRKLLGEPARVPTGERPECRQLVADRCPCCGGRMEPVGVVPRTATSNPSGSHDSS
jgi:hypothetical protein